VRKLPKIKMNIKPIDDLMFRPNGLLKVVPAWKLQEFPLVTLRIWCAKRGVYQLPTEELINWLSHQIKGRKTIEICAGNGVLGRELGIISTDSYMQTKPEIISYYRALQQEPISPPSDVIKYSANDAVEHFQPEVVIGSWVTELWKPGRQDGSVEGVDELKILKVVSKYISVGNDNSHNYKLSMYLPHEQNRFNWLVSRGENQAANHICVWGQ
jgi:hypothetical protein